MILAIPKAKLKVGSKIDNPSLGSHYKHMYKQLVYRHQAIKVYGNLADG